jgi:hypothetical protein
VKSIPFLVCIGFAIIMVVSIPTSEAQEGYGTAWNGEVKVHFKFDDWAPYAGHEGTIDIIIENQDDSPMRVELLAIKFDWQDSTAFYSDDMNEDNPIELAGGEQKGGISIKY